MMDWSRLLSTKRLGKEELEPLVAYRSPFEVDMDRLVFSAAWRRLADKMQVHGPAGNDMVRTRLTHSLETSRVGRSIGAWAGRFIVERLPACSPIIAGDIGHIVGCAAAAHDIGTPPFGHQGEDVISDWFTRSSLAAELLQPLDATQKAELGFLEGNAHGFRVLTRLQGWRKIGGLQLTVATLGTFAKYPWGVASRSAKNKYGFMTSETELFREVAEGCGLARGDAPDTWRRHPLAHLVEAADDVCYYIIDLEDAVSMHCLEYAEVEELLMPLIHDRSGFDPRNPTSAKLQLLRSRAIDTLIGETVDAFLAHYEAIMCGTFAVPLIDETPSAPHLAQIAKVSRQRIYKGGERDKTDLLAGRTLTTLLDAYCEAFYAREKSAGGRPGKTLSARHRALLRAFPGADTIPNDRSVWLRCVVDYLAGMTDGFAIGQATLIGR
jgi:dGTPase